MVRWARDASRLSLDILLTMQLEDQKQLLRDAHAEIQSLRRANEILGAKVEVMESFMCVLHSRPAERNTACAPDVAWALQKRIAQIDDEISLRPASDADRARAAGDHEALR